jgi:hypothetical protein
MLFLLGLCILCLVFFAAQPSRASNKRRFWLVVGGGYIVWGLLSIFMGMPEALILGLLLAFTRVKQLPFLYVPLVAGFTALIALTFFLRRYAPQIARKKNAPFFLSILLNAAFILATVLMANIKANQEISAAAQAFKPVCLQQMTFIQSLSHSQESSHSFYPHAILRTADGSQYYWSYRDREFFKGNDKLDPNLPCEKPST